MEDNNKNLDGGENTNSDIPQNKPNENLSADSVGLKSEYEKLKRLKDQYSQEAAEYKRKYQATLSEADKDRLAIEEERSRFKELEKELNSTKIRAALKDIISDDVAIEKISTKLVDSDNFGAINELKKFMSKNSDELKRKWEEEYLRNNPTPPPSNSTGKTEPKSIDEWSMSKWNELKINKPDEYARLIKKFVK